MNYQPRGISDQALQGPASYQTELSAAEALLKTQPTWNGVTAEAVARMRLQNRFKTGLDIARYTAALMRSDMAAYDADPTKYTQSLGCWHGFIAQQKLISVKKHFGTTDRRYLYLSGWMIAALRSEFGPLPDQSMHEKTSVPALIEELYTFLRQADQRELNDILRMASMIGRASNEVMSMCSTTFFCTTSILSMRLTTSSASGSGRIDRIFAACSAFSRPISACARSAWAANW